jgi:hypothetical protein
MDLAICLEKLGLAEYYWGPDLSSYKILKANWPVENPELPPEDSFIRVWDSVKENVLWSPIRKKRDALLVASDWTQLSDATCDKVAWARYRGELRNIPQTFSKPEEVIWPTPPTA